MKRLLSITILFFCLGSAFQLAAQTFGQVNISAPKATGMQVNVITGDLIYQRQNFLIPDIGFGLELSFTYSASKGWRYSFEWDIEPEFRKVFRPEPGCASCPGVGGSLLYTCKRQFKLIKNDWTEIRFELPDDVGLCYRSINYNQPVYGLVNSTPNKALGAFVETDSGELIYTAKTGEKYFFQKTHSGNGHSGPDGRITRIRDRYGNELSYEYEGDELRRITAPSGRYLEFEWQEFTVGAKKVKRLVKATDPNGTTPREFNYEYTDMGRLAKATNPLGGEVYYYYTDGRLTKMVDENGNETYVSYSGQEASPQVSGITTCLSKMTLSYTTQTTYLKEYKNEDEYVETVYKHEQDMIAGIAGNCCGYDVQFSYYPATKDLASITDANGNNTSFEYDTLSNITRITDPDGCTVEMEYEPAFSQMTEYKDKNGNITTYQYDPDGNLVQVNRPLGITEIYGYNSVGNITQYTDARNQITTYDYDVNGYVSQVNLSLGYTATMSYDDRGNILSETDANNHITTYQYDDLNRLNQITNAINGITAINYDNRRNILQVTNPKSQTTTFEYDQLDRLAKINAPLNLDYEFSYDGLGNLVQVADPRGGVVTNTYNSLNRVESITDQLGFQIFYTYDGSGNRISATDPNGNTTFYEYDPLNRLTRITDPMASQTQYTYDCNGNLASVLDANNNTVSIAYDALDRAVSFTDAMNEVSLFEYDGNSNLTKITDAKSNEVNYTYDALNRNTLITFADNTTRSYAYDGVGNVTSRTDNNGNTTLYQHDDLDRLVLRDYPDANDDVFQYDPLGNITFAQNQNATINFTYDDANRLTSETLNGKSTHYAYNTPNGKKTLIYPSGKIVEELYDKRGQLVNIKEDGTFLASFQYDPAGRLTSRNYANGTFSQYTYNANNWLTSITHNPNEFIRMLYTHDNVGNILTQEFAHLPDHSEAYTYDANYRLTNFKKGTLANGDIPAPAKETSYNYDALGNRTSVVENGVNTTYTSNEMNEYTSLSGGQNVNFGYDDNGNLLTENTTTYQYDINNRLVQISDNGNTTNFLYDPLSRRIREVSPMGSTNFYFQSFRSIEERNMSGEVERNLLYGIWIDDLMNISLPDSNFFTHANQIGSINGLTDNFGQFEEYYEYDPFGLPSYYSSNFNMITQSTVSKNFFAGRYQFPGNNLYYYRLRHYSPNLSRFIQRDPLGITDGLNLLTYTNNNPLNYIDPLGTQRGDRHCIFNPAGPGRPGTTTDCYSPGNSTPDHRIPSSAGGNAGNNPECSNSLAPECTNQENMGPFPPGEYNIIRFPDDACRAENWTPPCFNLVPRPGTNTYGRDGHNLHGGTRSRGCLLVNNPNNRAIFEDYDVFIIPSPTPNPTPSPTPNTAPASTPNSLSRSLSNIYNNLDAMIMRLYFGPN